ncbi:MAG: hypothetical protein F6J93_32130 [Oscillatoria sp. SIO1A7]|nr:hypothetical protein [Oscillatoria sp. SIO1A7]
MKIIQFPQERLTVEDLIELAKEQAIVLRQSNGSLFALAPVEDFQVEVEMLSQKPGFLEKPGFSHIVFLMENRDEY